MKYIKLFERFIPKKSDVILYQCDDFTIEYNSNDAFCAKIKYGQLGAISYMAELINQNSKYLKDPKLRNILVRSTDINSELDYLNLYPEKIKNIEKFRSGPMRHFWGDDYNKNIPIDIFMELTLKYTPMIADAIRDAKTLGDVIDNYQVIYDQLHSELEPIEIYIAANKYNV